jgi:hypothetical protein
MPIAFVLLLLAPIAACSMAPAQKSAGPDPADPAARVPPAAYRSTVGPYVSQRPVEPGSWQQQNERVAPAPRQ